MRLPRAITRTGAALALIGVLASGCSATHHRAKSKAPAASHPTKTPKQVAVALAHRMLDEAVLPAGARPTTAPAPRVLGGPSVPAMGNLEFAHRLWTVDQDPHAVWQWLQAHVARGFVKTTTSSGTNRGVPSWGVDDNLAIDPANISDAELQFGIAADAAGRAVVRVDAVVGWTEPRPANEFVTPRDRVVTVSVVRDVHAVAAIVTRVVTSDPKLVQPIVRAFNRLRVTPPDFVHGCPPIGPRTVSYRVAFSTSPGATPDIVATIGKCGGPGVTVGGHPATSLEGLVGVKDPVFYRVVAHVLGYSEPHFG